MNNLPASIESAMLAPHTTGAILVVILVLIVMQNRPFLRDVFEDSDRFWRFAARLALAMLAATLTWVTLFDNWAQISGEPYRLSRPWASQRAVFEPVASGVRMVSVALLGSTAFALAALFARHVGGYLFQIGMLIVMTVAWIPLFIFQQRLNLLVLDAAEASSSWAGLAGFTAFWVLRTGFGMLFIAATWLIAVFLIAPVVTLMLDVLGLRIPRATSDADPFFTAIENRSDGYDDVPLKAHWRPIRRPS